MWESTIGIGIFGYCGFVWFEYSAMSAFDGELCCHCGGWGLVVRGGSYLLIVFRGPGVVQDLNVEGAWNR